jgi:anti-sigma factor RsiW
MDRHEFEEKLYAHGGDLDRWPPAEREAAERLLAEDAACRALLAMVRADDEAIRSATLSPLDAALVGRIMAATRAPSPARLRFTGWRPLLPAGALAMLLVAGVGFKAGYDDGLGYAGETDLAAMVTGEFGLGTLP